MTYGVYQLYKLILKEKRRVTNVSFEPTNNYIIRLEFARNYRPLLVLCGDNGNER
jgi:hypothetical protein